MKLAYIEKRFNGSSLQIIKHANAIIAEYAGEGMSLTLRQLYYQFVSRDLIANEQKEYKRIGSIISDGRMAGLIDWNAIEDRTRNLKVNYHNTDVGDAVADALRQFMLDRWEGQEYRPEVWIEKEALIGVIAPICRELDVPYFACKGYVSQSEMWSAGMRMARHQRGGATPIIIHLGDHDPSGIDMTRDIDTRHITFMGGLEVQRIALNMDQVEQYGPPPNPAKTTDSRYETYIKKYGDESWELDALEPRVLRALIEDTVKSYRDEDIFQDVIDQENEYKETLERVEENWETL